MNRIRPQAEEVVTTTTLSAIAHQISTIRNRAAQASAFIMSILAMLMLASPAHAAAGGGQCIKTNDTLSAPLTPLFDQIEGALGGFLFAVVVVIIIALAVAAVVTVLSKKAPEFLRAIALVAVIPLVVIALVAIYGGLVTALNSAC